MILIEFIKLVLKNIVVINRKKSWVQKTTGNRIDHCCFRLKRLNFDRKFYGKNDFFKPVIKAEWLLVEGKKMKEDEFNSE